MTPPFTVSLGAATTDRDVAGGKGAALGRMVAAALPVPTGFVVTTAAYRRFVVVANLAPVIAETVAEVDAADSEALEAAAATIRAAFEAAAVPEDVAEEIVAAYHEFDDGGGRVAQGDLQRADGMETAVAVRSSATAEDLPGLSFAGQHQTLLNVRGEAAAVAAVRLCWASLWSARAIGYRRRMGVDDEGVAMAVVVQRLVPAEVAGVLFTVDPAGGDRERLVVNAIYGLGDRGRRGYAGRLRAVARAPCREGCDDRGEGPCGGVGVRRCGHRVRHGGRSADRRRSGAGRGTSAG